MKITDFLTRTVLNGVAFESSMALSIAIAVVERGSLVKSSWGSYHNQQIPQNFPVSVADFIALCQVYKLQASELVKKIEIANIRLSEQLKELHPEFSVNIIDELAIAAIDDVRRDNLHVEHSLQNIRTCDEYVKVGIDRLVEYYKLRYPDLAPTVE